MSELVKVYSPTGEVFENSPVNARDLVVHAGWSYDVAVVAVIVPEVKVTETVSEPEPEPVEEKAIEVEKVSEVIEVEEVAKEEVEEVKTSVSRGRPSKK
jgi:hypothetical protein